MVHHQIVMSIMFPAHISNTVHGLMLFLMNNVYPNGSPLLLASLVYKMTYEPTLHICDL